MKAGTANHGAGTAAVIGWTDSSTNVAADSVRSVISMKATNFDAAGTYTYTFYSTSGAGGTSGASSAAVTWTVTASASNLTAASIARKYVSTDQYTAKTNMVNLTASSDSAIVADKGSALAPAIVGYMFITLANSSSETSVLVAGSRKTVDETVTVTVSGPGLVDEANNPAASSAAKSATLNVISNNALNDGETLTIFNDGTAGTMTITFSKGSTTLGTQTITFTGDASTLTTSLSDTYTYIEWVQSTYLHRSKIRQLTCFLLELFM